MSFALLKVLKYKCSGLNVWISLSCLTAPFFEASNISKSPFCHLYFHSFIFNNFFQVCVPTKFFITLYFCKGSNASLLQLYYVFPNSISARPSWSHLSGGPFFPLLLCTIGTYVSITYVMYLSSIWVFTEADPTVSFFSIPFLSHVFSLLNLFWMFCFWIGCAVVYSANIPAIL